MVTGTNQVRPRLVTTGKAAAIIGVVPETLRRWVESGRMPAGSYVRMPSGRVKFIASEMEAIRAGSLNEAGL